MKEINVAWESVVRVILEHNPNVFNNKGTGIECVVREIKRLQSHDPVKHPEAHKDVLDAIFYKG